MNAQPISVVVSFSLLLAAVTAQDFDRVPRGSAVVTHEGVVHGLGADYSARFDAHGVTFTPALGGRVAAPQTLHYRMTTVRRGAAESFRRMRDIAPVVAGERVTYAHDARLSEVYDVAEGGIEQSFVLAERPAGNGDLVVTGEVTTQLPLAVVDPEGARFELPGVGGVAFGAVIGVDANGARCRGALRCDGRMLELSLPANFVDSAAYPLVLDPLIGSAFTVGNAPGGSDVQPAVSFDAASGRYLVVWNVNLSATVAEVRAQLVTDTGVVLGSQILLSSAGVPTERPAVANVNGNHRFVVVYAIRSSIPFPTGPIYFQVLEAVAVTPATGAVSNPVTVAGGASGPHPSQPAVGGDARAGSIYALIVYRSTSSGSGAADSIVAERVLVPTVSAPSPQGATTLATSVNRLGDPAVSASGGSSGRWLVVFGQSVVSPTAPFTRLYGQAINSAGSLCGAPLTLANPGAGADLREPTVATADGNTFAVAWQDAIAQSIHLRMLVWTGSCATGSWSTGLTQSPILQAGPASSPCLAFAKDKFVLVWTQTVSSLAKVYCKGLDPANCASCGLELRTDSTLVADGTPAIASRWDSGDAASDEGLVVWSNGTIRARRCEARGSGGIQSLGGGCFLGGLADINTYSGRPVLGDSTFALELLAPSAPVAALVVGFSAVNFPCGSCTLVPALDLVLAGVSPTPVPIPCQPGLIGTDLYTQWLLLKPSDCPLVPFLANSNTLKFTIGE